MTGWLFADAPLEPGEELIFRRVCTRRRGRRTVGGEVSVTDCWALVDHVVVIPAPPGSERFAALPRTPRARAEIDVGDELLVLQLEDAEALAGALRLGRRGRAARPLPSPAWTSRTGPRLH